MTTANRHDHLVQWIRHAGGALHDAVEVYHDHVTRVSFRVKDGHAVRHGDAIVTLPLTQTLSYLNAISDHPDFSDLADRGFKTPANSPRFPTQFLKTLPPHVIGRFFLIQQYLLGKQSDWSPYIECLPQPEHLAGMLPPLWPREDLELLKDTNVYAAVDGIKETLKQEYKMAKKLLPDELAVQYSRPLYYWAYAIFTSRSFAPSLIIPDYDSLDLSCDIDDFSILLPLYDIGNHSPRAKTTWTSSQGFTKLVVCDEYSAGQQVYNNYGPRTNAELLLNYGFILPETEDFHNDYVHVSTKSPSDGEPAGTLADTHLVSLRPMSDPSSLVGRSRQLLTSHNVMIPRFAHIQDSLVLALRDAIAARMGNDPGPDNVSDPRGKMDKDMETAIANVMGSKLIFDLDRLRDVQVSRENLTANGELAVRYLDQCIQVLDTVIHELVS